MGSYQIMTDEMEQEIIKQNLLGLAMYHKERCNDPECGIQLHFVQVAIERLGIILTDEERGILV